MREDMTHMKIALFGGTFDPVHSAHLLLAECAYSKIKPDMFIIMPAGRPYYKGREDITPDAYRLGMCRAAFDGRFTVSDAEIKRGGMTYTSDTLAYLDGLYPGAEIYFVCGADSFLSMGWWKNYTGIIKRAVICAAPRAGIDISEMEACAAIVERDGGRVLLIKTSLPDISSTQVREMLAEGADTSALLPPAVCRYIAEKGLYKSKTSDHRGIEPL